MPSIDVNDVLKRTQSTANGSTTDFSFSFQVSATSEIKVYEDSTLKTEGTHYDIVDSSASAGLNANGTGVVKFKTSPTDYTPANNKVITILSVMSLARSSVYSSGGNITAGSLETDFDRLHRIAGDFKEVKSRTVIAPEYSATDIDMTLPAKTSRAGKLLGFNSSTGNPEATFTVADGTTLASVTADIATLADIEDGTDATDAISTLAPKATQIGLLGNSTTVSNMNLLGVSDVITDMGLLGVSAVITDMDLLATSDNVTAMANLGTSTNVTNMANLNASGVITNINNLNASGVLTNIANLNASGVLTNIANLNASGVLTNIANLNATDVITNIGTVASNVNGVNSFAERYRISSSAPTSSLDIGDLYFDTTANELKVYKSSGWSSAGSTVNGTSARFHYNISGTPTTVTGADANGNTLAYDAGFADVYVNGVRMSPDDITITSGTSVVFASALADGDDVDIVGFGTFNVANIVSTGALNTGSITSGFGNIDTGSSTITTTGAISGGTLTGTLQTASQTNITGVGALDAGSITSGFGAIDNGSSAITTTGAISGGTVTSSGDLTVGGIDLFVDTSADKVGIGTSTANQLHQKLTIYSSAEAGIQFQNDATGVTNSTDGCRISVFEDDIQYTNYETAGKHIFNGGSGTASRLEIEADGDVNVKTGNLVIGTSGKGIDFSAGAGSGSTSNLLDEYEEGTFTFGSNSNVAFVSNSNVGKYTKIGRMVHLQFHIDISSVSSTNHFYMSGMPFPQDANDTNTLNGYSVSAVVFYNFDTYYTGSQVMARMENQSSNMYFYESYDSVNTSIVTNTRATNSTEINVSHTYFTST